MARTRMLFTSSGASPGFSLLEALVATGMLSVGLVALAQLVLFASGANGRAQEVTRASVLAEEKLEELRGNGVAGLSRSPSGVLDGNADGYCDFLDADGRLLAGGDAAYFVRRWSVAPVTGSADALVLQVVVLRAAGRVREIARITTIRARIPS